MGTTLIGLKSNEQQKTRLKAPTDRTLAVSAHHPDQSHAVRPAHLWVLIPFVLLDILVSVYQQICFRIYSIPLVRRADFLILDRPHLAYLNAIEKVNCLYRSYCNGLLEYVQEVAAHTEQYWCPIKHARRSPDPRQLEDCFVDYGDIQAYRAKLEALRRQLAQVSSRRANQYPENHGEDEPK